jgi:7,8-didemethyl-8-hydroxy-5-deazariboflavin synthase
LLADRRIAMSEIYEPGSIRSIRGFTLSNHTGSIFVSNHTLTNLAVTYSPALTLVPTYECFNRCSYCNFRVDPGKDAWLSLEAAKTQLSVLKSQSLTHRVTEILILSGEVHPQSSRRSAWFEHICQLCELALEMGFLPHTNVGPLSYIEFSQLKQLNVSMGLMLEQVTPTLLETVHRHAPSKVPQQRVQQLVWAGELKIPFTTGILLGLGETEADRVESLQTIAAVHARYGHIQEVILQPYCPGTQEDWGGLGFDTNQLPEVVRWARQILPQDVAIQIPPNLLHQPSVLLDCLAAGARDLGGIGPVDEVNPDYPHPTVAGLREILEPQGWQLVPRLPVYPHYVDWLPERLQQAIGGVGR